MLHADSQSSSRQLKNLYFVSINLHFLGISQNESIQYAALYDWLDSLNVFQDSSMKYIPVLHSFRSPRNISSFIWIFHIAFIFLSVDGWLRCFYFLPVMNTDSMNIHAQILMWLCFCSIGHKSHWKVHTSKFQNLL